MSDKKSQENLVVKHNDLNSISYFDSAVQLKIFSRLIVEIRKNPNKKLYSLLIRDVLNEVSSTSDINKNYAYLKDVARGMFKVIDIPVERGFDLRALFININTKDKSFIYFEVNPSLKPYILKLTNNFTYYFLENIASLNSNFSIRIYELLKQYQDVKTGEGWVDITIDDLKQFLGISGKYKQYAHFKTRIILVAKKELEVKTDIKFNFVEEKKSGKKVDRVVFQILPNKDKIANTQLSFDFSEADELNSLQSIRNEISKEVYGLGKKIINKILENIITAQDQEVLLGSLRAAKNYINNNQGKCNPPAITQSAIKDGWYLKAEKPSEVIPLLPAKSKIIINNSNSFWLQFSSILKVGFGEEIFNKWLSYLNFVGFEGGKLNLVTKGEDGKFQRDWIKKEYQPQMLALLQDSGVESIYINYFDKSGL